MAKTNPSIRRSATEKAWDRVFTNHDKSQALDAFKTLFPNTDLECWQFSPLHEAVLGINR